MQVLISLSLALVGGLLMSRLAKKLNLPAVTAYLSTRTVVNTAWAMPTVMA